MKKMNINLAKFKHAITKTKKGTNCIVLPIEDNDFVLGKNNDVYLDLIAFEIKNKKPDQLNTHLLKQSIPKEKYEKLTDEEKTQKPIIGNAKLTDDFDNSNNNNNFTEEIDNKLPF